MEQLPSVEVKWLAAPNDGVGPALLLTIRRGKPHTTPIQYLVNVPEGFSRLVLEHKCRPGPGLRALLLTDLSQAAQGGLAGLMLRLRQDGHSSLRVVGLAGIRDMVDGLSYFVRWSHPTLELSALTSAQQDAVYDDEWLQVRPLWRSCLLWEVPDWLTAAAAGAPAAEKTAAPAEAAEEPCKGRRTSGRRRRKSSGLGKRGKTEVAKASEDASDGGSIEGGGGRVDRDGAGAGGEEQHGGEGKAGGVADGGGSGNPLAELLHSIRRTSAAAAAAVASKARPVPRKAPGLRKPPVAETAAAGSVAAAGRGDGGEGGADGGDTSDADAWESGSCDDGGAGGGGSGSGAAAAAAAGNDRSAAKKGSSSSSGSSDSDSEQASSSSSSSSSDDSSSDGGSSDSEEGAGPPPAKRRHNPQRQPAATSAPTAPVAPAEPTKAKSQADIFSELDRLFLAGAAGAGGGAGRNPLAGLCGGVGGGGKGKGGRRGGGGAAARRPGGGPKSTSAAAAAAAAAPRVDAALRSQVLAQLRAAPADGNQQSSAAAPPPTLPRRPKDAKLPATANATAEPVAQTGVYRSAAAAAAAVRTRSRAAATAAAAAAAASARPGVESPLGYLMYFKPTRQALLVSSCTDAAAADALAVHPATQLLQAAPPGLLLAVAHMVTSPAVARRHSYRSVVRRLPGPHVWWCRQAGAAAIGGGGKCGGGGRGGVRAAAAGAAEEGHKAQAVAASEEEEEGDLVEEEVEVRGEAQRPPAVAAAAAVELVAAADAGSKADTQPGKASEAPAAPSPLQQQQQQPPQDGSAACKGAKLGAGLRADAEYLAGLGHLGSYRVTVRLNAVAPAIFPLPYGLRRRQDAKASSTGGDGDTEVAGCGHDGELAAAIRAVAASAASAAVSAATSGAGSQCARYGAAATSVTAAARAAAATAGGGGGGSLPKQLYASLMATLTGDGGGGGEGGGSKSQGGPVRRSTVSWRNGTAEGAAADGDGGASKLGATADRRDVGVSERRTVAALQRDLLEDRRSTGLAQMLQVLRSSCPRLTRTAEAERLMQPPPPPQHTPQQAPQQQQLHPGTHPQQQQQQQFEEHHYLQQQPGIAHHGMLASPPQQAWNATQGQEALAAPTGNGGWRQGNGAAGGGTGYWHGGTAADPDGLAAAELAAAAAAYGLAERTGRLMRPSYTHPPPASTVNAYYGDDRYGNGGSGDGWYGDNGGYGGYHDQQQQPYPRNQVPYTHAYYMRPPMLHEQPVQQPLPPQHLLEHPQQQPQFQPQPSQAEWPQVTAAAATDNGNDNTDNRGVAAKLRAAMRGSRGGVDSAAAAEDGRVEAVGAVGGGDPATTNANPTAADATAGAATAAADAGDKEADAKADSNRDVARRVRQRLHAASNPTCADANAAVVSTEVVAAATEAEKAKLKGEAAADAEADEEGLGSPVQATATEAPSSYDNRSVAEQLRAALRCPGGRAAAEVTADTAAAGPARTEGGAAAVTCPTAPAAAGSAEAADSKCTTLAAAPPPLSSPPDRIVSPASEPGRDLLPAAAAAALDAYVAEMARYGTAASGDGGAAAGKEAPQAAPSVANGGDNELPPPPCLLPYKLPSTSAASDSALPSSSSSPSAAAAAAASSPAGDVSVLFLGTGSAEPSKYRGASAVLVRGVGPTRGSLLIDAGEGAYGAMVRWLGPRGAEEQAASLSLVWLSHKHPDHILGLPALLEARARAAAGSRGRTAATPGPRGGGSGGGGGGLQPPGAPGGDALPPPLLVVVGPQEVAEWLARVAPRHPAWRFTFLHCADFVGGSGGGGGNGNSGNGSGFGNGSGNGNSGSRCYGPNGAVAAVAAAAAVPGPSGQLLPPQACYCCPPQAQGASGPGTSWAGGVAAGFGAPTDPSFPASASLAPGRKAPPSAAARLRWHQQQRPALAAAAAATPHPPPNPQAPPAPPRPQQLQRQWQGPQVPPQQPQQLQHWRPQPQQQRPSNNAAAAAAVCCGLGLVRWSSVGVHHCRDAWGLVLEHADGWKLVYSGDTRPCPALISAGRDATLLIHEATFEPCLEQQARTKRHSTSAEAAEVAQAMGAYRTVLTHFSQRYPRVPSGLDPWVIPLQRRPVPAFDGMLVPLSALPSLPHILPPLALALGEAPAEGQEGQ